MQPGDPTTPEVRRAVSACPRAALDDPQRVPLSLRNELEPLVGSQPRLTRVLTASSALSPCDSCSVYIYQPLAFSRLRLHGTSVSKNARLSCSVNSSFEAAVNVDGYRDTRNPFERVIRFHLSVLIRLPPLRYHPIFLLCALTLDG